MEIAGLDAAVGFCTKCTATGRPWLIEEFRPVIVDHLVIRLCTTGKVSPAGFTTSDDDAGGCRMDRDTLRVFLAGYENRMLTVAHHPGAGRRASYRNALAIQARHLADVITGREPAYLPISWR